ncbi:hypothetical protein PR002_g16017 [Phytophthora rubi]|uniref:Protein transport protein sec16 n=1 Tax=Phytophthora rubi TaxID=129364 RepID=A0A6A3KM16_9STRA|nr:hypothetical protein PR002_g16017 [Phytophthora rubi]
MDGARGSGFFPAPGAATRARPVSAGTRLRAKPAAQTQSQDFFASLGIDATSRGRTGSSASTSSNRSYSSLNTNMNTRPASASSSSSLSAGWRPPPIGGLGSQRAAPPPPPPAAALSVGSLSVQRPTMTTTTSSSVSKPTQLFSMDAEELYSDDGWECDSPSTVLSKKEKETMTQAPALLTAAAAAAEAPDDEFAWGDDDDAFASPVAKAATPLTQPPPLATDSSAVSELEMKMEMPPPPAATFHVSSFSAESTSSALETQSTPQETKSVFNHAQVETGHETFETNSFGAALVAVPTATEVQQEEQWDEDWDQRDRVEAAAAAEAKTTIESSVTSTTSVTTMTTTTTTVQTETVVAPVELTSPGAAAGEFWGEGDADELFDHDDHADEEWDESVKGQANAQQNAPNPAFPGQDTSFSMPAPPPPASTSVVEAPANEQQSALVPEVAASPFDYSAASHVEEVVVPTQEESIGQSSLVAEGRATPELPPPPTDNPMYSTEAPQEAKPATSLDAESSPFSSTIAKCASQDDDPNVYPEAPRSARFLHTPTGTGGPFGRVPSPQGNESSSFQNEFSTDSATHDTQQTDFAGGEQTEASDSYTESSVRWDAGSMHADGDMPSEAHAGHHSARQGQSDEEERDSVVSFSGENSFFPSAGRPSSLYGGSQSSFASHRMYQSSVASTDHDGSSIASYGVSSAGATFGGSERVSEGGAFSDGTVSETPSMVDSSNASTAFGTDFPSVSEGQFSAPGTTIGGSDNASDGGFSDGNASETTSMCESVNTNPRYVSEFSSSSGHYVTEAVERRDAQEPFASSAPKPDSAFGESEPAPAASMFGGDDSSADANPFASSPSAFPPSQQTTTTPPAAAPASDNVIQEEDVQNAASLFGATAGADVPNPFSSFGAPPAATSEAKPVAEHELPTSDAGDLFGSGSASSGFESSFAQPVQNSFGSSYQTQDQSYNQAGRGGFTGSASASSSAQSQFPSSSPFDRPAVSSVSTSSPFESQSSSTYNSADPFAARGGTQNAFGNSAPSAGSGFGGGSGYNSGVNANPSASSHFGGSGAASADSVFSSHSRADGSSTATADHFGQQTNAQAYNASYGEGQNYNQYAQGGAPKYPNQSSASASATPDHFRHQPPTSVDDHAQATASTFSGHSYGQASDASAHFSRQSSASSYSSGYSGQNRFSSQQVGASTPGVPDNFSHHSAAEAFAGPAQPSYGSQQDNRYSGQQYGQASTPATLDSYNRYSAADVFGSASSAQPPHASQQSSHYSSHQFGQRSTPATPGNYSQHSASEVFGSGGAAQQDYNHGQYGRSASRGQSGGFGDHTRSSSSASADAFFGRSSAVSETDASAFGGERVATPSSGSVYQQQPAQAHAQPSFSRSGSNASSHAEQFSSHVSANSTPMRTSGHARDLNTSYGSIEDKSFSRHASSSSMNRYGSESSFEPQRNLQQHEESASSRPPVNANSFFGGTSAATTEVSASSFFGTAVSQDASEFQTSQSQAPVANYDSGISEVQATSHYASPPQQGHEQPQQYSQAEPTQHESSSDYFGAGAVATPAPVEASPSAEVESTRSVDEVPAPPSERLQHQESSSFDGFAGTNVAATEVDTQESVIPPSANEDDTNRPQAFDGFADSSSQGFDETTSSGMFSSPPAPQATATTSTHQFQHSSYGQETQEQQHHAHDAAAASLHFAETHSSYQQSSGASYSTASPGNYFSSGAPGAGTPSPAGYSLQHQQPQHQAQQPQHQKYQQHQEPPQQQQHGATGYGYHGGVTQTQPQRPGFHAASAIGHGYTSSSMQPSAASLVKTSNKYKDPCVAPPSCLASFGFGGNVVTMFPKRKLRLNIAGSSYRNSPRGLQSPSEFDNGSNTELRKGPVSVYRMDQLHPKDKEFEQMDVFPGPLTEDVSDEAILEYLDDLLKRSEAPTSAEEAEDENDRLLLGVLRVLVKYNGKLRSDPGTLNPSDPNSPEAQLIALLSENSKRRCGNQPPTFPATRKTQSVTHPDLALKHSNELRELLLVGDRKGAVSSAMSAHMWPEAMLIASFTDKEEYRRVLRTYLDETYATGDPCRALFMSFADQQEKSVQEPKRLLQANVQQSAESLILSKWVPHAQVLLANRTADTNKILTELGDRLWNEAGAVAAAHVCYLLAGIQVEAPMPTSKMALLGGDHRTPKEARFYVSPGAVQRTELYEWAQKHSKGASANLMIPFQGYKLIYAMLLADHGKLETAFKYVSSMLAVIKAVTATMKPGTSMYLEGMKNQLTVLDDRLRQHLGQDRVASVAASTGRGGGRKQGGKWGLGSALSIMGKIVNRVVEGTDSATTAPAGPSATTPGGLYANEATPLAASYPTTASPAPSHPQQHVQQTPPTSSHGPSPVPANSYGHATPPLSQGSAAGSSNGYNRAPPAAPPAGPYSRPGGNTSGPFSGNGRLGPQQHQQTSGPFSGNGRPAPSGPYSNSGPASRGHGTVPLMRSQHSMEPPGSNHSTHSNASFNGMPPAPVNNAPPQQQQPPLSQSSQHSQDTPTARPAFQKPAPIDVSHDDSLSQPKALAAGLAAEVAASLPPTDAATLSGPSSDKGKASPKFKSVKKPARSKTPPPSGSSKGSGWLSGISSFIATKMNPEAKVAKLGEHMEAYYDEDAKRWVFPGETTSEEPTMPSAPPTGPLPGSAPGSSATGAPPPGANSAPGSMSSGPAPSDDPLAALMAPPPTHMLMKKDPLAAMMAPPARAGMYNARRGGSTAQRKPPRPQFAVFKPTAALASAPDEQSE